MPNADNDSLMKVGLTSEIRKDINVYSNIWL